MKSKAEKKAEAEVRRMVREHRTPADQLKVLDKRLGKNAGAVKERARLRGLS